MIYKNGLDKSLSFLICFEGMDASYKETNSNYLLEYLRNTFFKDLYKERKIRIEKITFPTYDSRLSYYLNHYLHGRYNDKMNDIKKMIEEERTTHLHINKKLINYFENNLDLICSFFFLEMFDWCARLVIDKPTIFVLDRYYVSEMYYLTKDIHMNSSKLYIKDFVDRVHDKAMNTYWLDKPNFLYKMYNSMDNMIAITKKRKNTDMYESDIEYLRKVRDVFISDKYINKDILENTTGNNDILYTINVENRSRENLEDDMKVSINNTMTIFKNRVLEYYKEDKKNV